MFENIGEKIKNFATVITVLGIIGSIIGGIALFVIDRIVVGLLVVVFGGLFSWIGSFVLYGFGELIEKTNEIAKNTKRSSQLAVADALEKTNDTAQNNVETTQLRSDVIKNYKDDEDGEDEFIDQEELEFKELNTAKIDECPVCFHKISEKDSECSYCGYKLKN